MPTSTYRSRGRASGLHIYRTSGFHDASLLAGTIALRAAGHGVTPQAASGMGDPVAAALHWLFFLNSLVAVTARWIVFWLQL